ADEQELEAYHDRIREAVVSQVPADAQTGLHARLAEAMERAGRGDPETLATHFQRGGNRERATHYARQAAAQASEALAFDRAARPRGGRGPARPLGRRACIGWRWSSPRQDSRTRASCARGSPPRSPTRAAAPRRRRATSKPPPGPPTRNSSSCTGARPSSCCSAVISMKGFER